MTTERRNLAVYYIQAATRAREYALLNSRPLHQNVIQTLRQLQHRLHQTWSLTPKALANADRPRVLRAPINCSYEMRTVDKLPRYRIRYWILAGSSNCSITIYCIHFLPGDRPLRLQFYEWLRCKLAVNNLLTQHSVGRCPLADTVAGSRMLQDRITSLLHRNSLRL
jgi:hypothetical protein